MDRVKNIHPGEVLCEEFLAPMGISQDRLAKQIGVPAIRISEICAGKRGITADTALRLARALAHLCHPTPFIRPTTPPFRCGGAGGPNQVNGLAIRIAA